MPFHIARLVRFSLIPPTNSEDHKISDSLTMVGWGLDISIPTYSVHTIGASILNVLDFRAHIRSFLSHSIALYFTPD